MQSFPDNFNLPLCSSSDLHLSHPNDEENRLTWELMSSSWKDALTVPQYVEEVAHLMTVALAKGNGATQWVLTEKSSPPDQRLILAYCETFRKRTLISDKEGNVTEGITYGVASVYCNPKYRNRGFASRLLRELARTLPKWQTNNSTKCVASILYSEIGKDFYERLGWRAFPSYHIEFDASDIEWSGALEIRTEDIRELCEEDEAMARKTLSNPSNGNTRLMILPDYDHMLWQHSKEEFACERLFGRKPQIKGALAGYPGSRVWVVWTYRYYETPGHDSSQNALYILRLVVEDHRDGHEDAVKNREFLDLQVRYLKAVLQAAQAEAIKWSLGAVRLWNPSPHVQEMIERTKIQHRMVKRQTDDICSLLWFGKDRGNEDELEWVANERYAWC